MTDKPYNKHYVIKLTQKKLVEQVSYSENLSHKRRKDFANDPRKINEIDETVETLEKAIEIIQRIFEDELLMDDVLDFIRKDS